MSNLDDLLATPGDWNPQPTVAPFFVYDSNGKLVMKIDSGLIQQIYDSNGNVVYSVNVSKLKVTNPASGSAMTLEYDTVVQALLQPEAGNPPPSGGNTTHPAIIQASLLDDAGPDWRPQLLLQSPYTNIDFSSKAAQIKLIGRGAVTPSSEMDLNADVINVNNPVKMSGETWHNFPFANGWSGPLSTAAQTGLQYRKNALGDIDIRGLAFAPSAVWNSVIGVMPAGYASAKQQMIYANPFQTAMCGARVDPDGTVSVFGNSTLGQNWWINGTVSTDNI